MWLGFACLLAVFDFRPYVDPASGKEELPKMEVTTGLVSHIERFKYHIRVRSEQHERLIRSLGV